MCNIEEIYVPTHPKHARKIFRKLMGLKENQPITEEMLDEWALGFVAVRVNDGVERVREWLLEPNVDDSEPQTEEKTPKAEPLKEYTSEDVNQLIAKCPTDINYYITIENDNGEQETIYRLNCSLQDARNVFLFAIRQQAAERKKVCPVAKWHTLRLFDSNGDKIAQES